MNVVYDLLGFQNRENGERGIARFVLHLALALERVRPGLVGRYLMHPHLPFPAGAEKLVATGRVVRCDQPGSMTTPSGGGVLVVGSPFEDFHLPSEVAFPRWARSPGWQVVAVLHDLIPGLFPELYLKVPLHRHYYQARLGAVGAVDWLLANSQTSADDAVSMLGFDPSRITVIGAGAHQRFRPSPLDPAAVAGGLVRDAAVPGLRPGYVLFPTGLDPRKNNEAMISAYGSLPPTLRRRHQLVVACRLDDHGLHYLDDLTARAGASGDVLAPGFVSDEVLCRLYQGAELVVFPSWYEGFGLPVLEAMKCRAPVIVADASSLREVQTLPEARFDPSSADSIAAALEQALIDPDFRAQLRRQEPPPFSWDRAAASAASAIDGLRDRAKVRMVPAGRRLPRLALVCPLPADGTGATEYAGRLVAELRHRCDLTVFTGVAVGTGGGPGADGAGAVLAGVPVEPFKRLDLIESGGGAFDRILYLLGNGASSVGVLEALRSRPGWVLLHDVTLASLYGHQYQMAPERLAGGSVGATVARLYPGRYRALVEQMATLPAEVTDRFGIVLLREVAQLAEQLLVHSAYEASVVELDTGVRPLVAFSMPSPAGLGIDRADGAGCPVISSFDPTLSPPGIETLLGALAIARQQVPEARLRLVGPLPGHRASQIGELAREAGVAGAVELLQPVDAEGHIAARVDTTVAVQLRGTGRAATSTVAELLVFGVPTVVADCGPMTELPDDVVVKVDPEVSPADLGAVLAGLLADHAGRELLSQAARGQAKAGSFAEAAASLVALV